MRSAPPPDCHFLLFPYLKDQLFRGDDIVHIRALHAHLMRTRRKVGRHRAGPNMG